MTTMPVTPRFCGSLPQLPSSFCDFFRNATALSTVVLYLVGRLLGDRRRPGSSANADGERGQGNEQTLPHGLILAK